MAQGDLEHALKLSRSDGGVWTAHADPNYESMNGMFGGWTAAVALRAGCDEADSEATTLPTACTQDLNSSQDFNLGSVKFQIKWHGIGKFADTNGGSLSEGYFSENGPEATGTAGLLFIDGIDPSTSGSFASSASGFLFGGQSTETPTQLGLNCTPKTKGQPGTGGLKKLTIDSGQLGAGA